ncbi:MAG: CofH family radical SAM protein [Desulfobacterales bacterium]|jgi:cyclic dehypoxanthinyl futalosine synthase
MAFLTRLPMGELMALAHAERNRRHPRGIVTFVVDTNPNYTNVCETRCAFCAFCRRPDDPDAYTLSPEQVAETVSTAHRAGATTVLLQGGNHPGIGLKDWIAYIRAIRKACPAIHIHPFSPAEYVWMAAHENRTVESVLQAIFDEGIRTIPGGGAEILVDQVRRKIAATKATAQQWLDACESAHRIGFRTTATLMFGHLETDRDIIDHLLRLRSLQDRTRGITSFIAWSFKPGGSPLGKVVSKSAHPARYVRIIATARLMLDNIHHIQSSWFSESTKAGQLGLLAGADDFGGILVEENVLKTTGHCRSASVDGVKALIRQAGFTPAQRDSDYRVLRVFEGETIGEGPADAIGGEKPR